jgi:hypothetical protein
MADLIGLTVGQNELADLLLTGCLQLCFGLLDLSQSLLDLADLQLVTIKQDPANDGYGV